MSHAPKLLPAAQDRHHCISLSRWNADAFVSVSQWCPPSSITRHVHGWQAAEAGLPAEERLYCPYPPCSALMLKGRSFGKPGVTRCPHCEGCRPLWWRPCKLCAHRTVYVVCMRQRASRAVAPVLRACGFAASTWAQCQMLLQLSGCRYGMVPAAAAQHCSVRMDHRINMAYLAVIKSIFCMQEAVRAVREAAAPGGRMRRRCGGRPPRQRRGCATAPDIHHPCISKKKLPAASMHHLISNP